MKETQERPLAEPAMNAVLYVAVIRMDDPAKQKSDRKGPWFAFISIGNKEEAVYAAMTEKARLGGYDYLKIFVGTLTEMIESSYSVQSLAGKNQLFQEDGGDKAKRRRKRR